MSRGGGDGCKGDTDLIGRSGTRVMAYHTGKVWTATRILLQISQHSAAPQRVVSGLVFPPTTTATICTQLGGLCHYTLIYEWVTGNDGRLGWRQIVSVNFQ